MLKNGNGAANFKESHGYIIDGVWYPRVTSIVNIKAKPALYRFYGSVQSFAEGEAIKNRSAEEGTLIHEAVQNFMVGKAVSPDPRTEPSIKALKSFLEAKHIQFVPEWIERRILSFKERYAGTIDALALIDGKFGVLDIKTSQEIYRDFNLQTAAYFDALNESVEGLQTRWILRIDQVQMCLSCGAKRRIKGGREKIRNNGVYCRHNEWSEVVGQVELKEFPHWADDYRAFLAAKKLWEWENENYLKAIGYLR
ncbi:MAG: hypothetical protein HYS87_02720 [Candidatus Colwellbacteria bacterium]|nr:hypothetical protein [Candidatus Colwellbacteria bacterium]